MKKRLLPSLLALCMVLTLLSAALAADTGVPTLSVSTADELAAFAQAVNSGTAYEGQTVELTADITLNAGVVDWQGKLQEGEFAQWTPIGTENAPFKGSFNGGGHTITGLYIDTEQGTMQGLFGAVVGGTVYNVTVKDSYISARAHAGAVVGYLTGKGIVSSCHGDNNSVYTVDRSGGIVGWMNDSDICNCSADGYCYSNRCSGGIVGDIYSSGKLYNCFSAVTVEGKELVGGISGGTTKADIQNCLKVGSVQKGGYLIAGGGGSRTITNSFALQNDSVNAGLTVGTSSQTARTFPDTAAVLSQPVTYNGTACTTALDALNAWVDAVDSEIVYSPWVQTSKYPYLRDGVVSSVKTSFGSEISTWASPEMEKAYEMDLIPEVLVGEDLTQKITRAEFAAVAVKTYESLAGVKAIPAVVNPFDDCAEVEVLKAYNIGAVNGTGADTFSPDLQLNREQAAAMLTRVFKRVTMPGWTLAEDSKFPLSYTMPTPFTDDADISPWARESVYFMAANGIINGISGGRFAPKNVTTAQEAQGYANATREQALAIAVRMVEKLR